MTTTTTARCLRCGNTHAVDRMSRLRDGSGYHCYDCRIVITGEADFPWLPDDSPASVVHTGGWCMAVKFYVPDTDYYRLLTEEGSEGWYVGTYPVDDSQPYALQTEEGDAGWHPLIEGFALLDFRDNDRDAAYAALIHPTLTDDEQSVIASITN